MTAPTIEFEPGIQPESPGEPVNDIPPPPPTTATGRPRTASTPGRKPGQRNGEGKSSAVKAAPAPRPSANRPPAPKKGKKDYRAGIKTSITKLCGAGIAFARKQNAPVVAADAMAILVWKDPLADALNAMAQDADWLGKFLEKVAVVAPGAELASVLMGIVTQIGVNHSAIPLELGQMMDAQDPRVLLGMAGMHIVQQPVSEPQAA